MDDVRYISADFNSRIRKSALAPGDVVTVRTGKPGATAVIPDWIPSANCSDLVITRPGPNLDPRWLSYYINGVAGGYVASRLVGAVQQHFNVGAAKEIRLSLPPLREQRGIGLTLGVLDDKIASNSRAIRNLEQIAHAVFESTFLSERGPNRHLLGEYCTFVKGKTPRGVLNEPTDGYLPYLTIDALTSGTSSYALVEKAVISGSSDILMVMDGASSGAVYPGQVGVVASTFARVDISNPPMRDIIFRALKYYGQEISRHNTGSAIPHTDKAAVLGLEISIPDEIDAFAGLFAAIHGRVAALFSESARLESLRDALLPELLSGRIRVPEADEA